MVRLYIPRVNETGSRVSFPLASVKVVSAYSSMGHSTCLSFPRQVFLQHCRKRVPVLISSYVWLAGVRFSVASGGGFAGLSPLKRKQSSP